MHQSQQTALADRFLRFAAESAAQGSPFYEALSQHVANCGELLDLAGHASREPIPNVFLGAIHYLLLKGATHPLGDYYPSVVVTPRADDGLPRALLDFCRRFREPVTALIKSRLVQTNEIGRSAVLAPAFSTVYERTDQRHIALVEMGTHAGLNLLRDQYRICYSDGTVLGDPNSSIEIHCELRGKKLPAAAAPAPVIVERIGIDLHPINLDDADERLWLRALVWPDHPERAARLEAAMKLASRYPRRLIAGDVLTALQDELARVPLEATLCVFQSSVLYQFAPAARQELVAQLARASLRRPIWHVSAESEEGLWLFQFADGKLSSEQELAAFDSHGRWLQWFSRAIGR